MRTCVGCRQIAAKSSLVRIVDSPIGRGAYVHPRETCIEAAVKGGAQRALRRSIRAEEIRRTIVKNSAGLPDADAVETASAESSTQR